MEFILSSSGKAQSGLTVGLRVPWMGWGFWLMGEGPLPGGEVGRAGGICLRSPGCSGPQADFFISGGNSLHAEPRHT